MRVEERGLAYYVDALMIAVSDEVGLNNVNEAPKAFRERKRLNDEMNESPAWPNSIGKFIT